MSAGGAFEDGMNSGELYDDKMADLYVTPSEYVPREYPDGIILFANFLPFAEFY